jgi:antitoxin (DNA-binding transcriptional repressor) of toxin-antitoxin stability system
MKTIDIHEAKTHLSLVDKAAQGESFLIAKADKPMVKAMAIHATEPGHMKRIGFLVGEIDVPDDFDDMGATEDAPVASVLAERRPRSADVLLSARHDNGLPAVRRVQPRRRDSEV